MCALLVLFAFVDVHAPLNRTTHPIISTISARPSSLLKIVRSFFGVSIAMKNGPSNAGGQTLQWRVQERHVHPILMAVWTIPLRRPSPVEHSIQKPLGSLFAPRVFGSLTPCIRICDRCLTSKSSTVSYWPGRRFASILTRKSLVVLHFSNLGERLDAKPA